MYINLILISLFFFCFFLSLLHDSVFVSVFFLIALFLVSSFVFLLNGFEFLGFLYLIVYVGAVAVLFLFMVMLFDKSEYLFFSAEQKLSLIERIWFIFFSFLLISSFILFFMYFLVGFGDSNLIFLDLIKNSETLLVFFNNLEAIGSVLYTYYILEFFGAGLILLLGMVGAIVLTQMVPLNITLFKHQDIKSQILRKRV